MGDTLVIHWRAGVGTIFAADCTGLTVQNVSVYASSFIGVFTTKGFIKIDHVQVIPRSGTDRLIATREAWTRQTLAVTLLPSLSGRGHR
jgi:hypothetical protein